MKTFRWLRLASLGAWMISGCSQGTNHASPPPQESTGGIQLGLDLAGGASLSQATYTITGPNNYYRSVVVMLGSASKLSTFIGGTPPGAGYRLTVTGVARDGVSLCTGVSAPFDVVSGKTTVVSLILRCEEPEPTGNIQANGSLNYCAVIDSLMASAASVPVGATVTLTSLTHDKNGGPQPIQYAWAASTGSFDDPRAANPTYSCAAAGSATITLTITDGDCGDSRTVAITCAGPGQALPGAPDAAAPLADSAVAPDAAAPPPDTAGPEAAVPPDPCLVCEASSPYPACASQYNLCVSLPGSAAAGPATGAPRKDLCIDLLSCIHATRCDAGGILRDCFCGKLVDEYTCGMNPTGPCKAAFYAAGESTNNATIMARISDPSFAVGVAAALVDGCESRPEPLCGPWCGH